MITLQERVHAAPKPDDWQLDKLHQVFRVRRGHKNAGMKDDNLLSLSYGRIIQKDIETADGLLPENFEGYQIVEPGNIVLRLTDLQNDKRSLRQGLVTQRGIITSAYDAVEVQRDNDPRFWFYALLALDLAKHYYSLGGGVRQSVKFADFPNDWVYRPDLATQRQIADFLDRETARIDLLIEKKQRLVALLEEKLQSKLETAVIAEESKKVPLRRALINLEQGWSPDCETRPKEQDEWGVLKVGCVNSWSFSSAEHKALPINLVPRPALEVREGDLLMSRANSPELVGSAAIVHNAATRLMLCDKLYRLKLDTKLLSPSFALLALRSKAARMHYSLRSNGASASMQNISQETVRSLPVPLPSLRKQAEVVAKIERQIRYVSETTCAVNASIDRLKEYRSALITAAVTGQIDVQSYAESGTPDRRLDAIQEEMGA
ncbi:hypothetical protein ACN2XU_23475 [Primorskyibacter sp. 2E107]|uniref:restriction endonuclease subunit S n=1 Tax=Primorskyibacter sp. 2E107 TaxID=3403458 RepID=UPI003AF851CF